MGKRERKRARQLKKKRTKVLAKHSKPVPKRADKQKEPIRQKRPRSDSSKSAVGSSLFTNDPSSYSLSKTLVVGDGDFSFSLALAQQWQNVLPSKRRLLVCSSYDSYESVKRKYGEIKMDRAIRSLADILKQDHRDSNQRLDITEEKGKVLHGIDATQLGEYFPPGSFNRIIFNFPHCGSQRVHENRNLVSQFLKSSRAVLAKGGQVHITLKICPPYSKWDIESLAKRAGLLLVEVNAFDFKHYPGYKHQTTDPTAKDLNPDAHSKTFIFVPAQKANLVDASRKRPSKKKKWSGQERKN